MKYRITMNQALFPWLVLLIFFFLGVLIDNAQEPRTSRFKDELRPSEVFVGWLKHTVNAQLQFKTGAKVSYSKKELENISKDLKAGLACLGKGK